MPTGWAKGVLTDIGTEELAHWEMIATMVYEGGHPGGVQTGSVVRLPRAWRAQQDKILRLVDEGAGSQLPDNLRIYGRLE